MNHYEIIEAIKHKITSDPLLSQHFKEFYETKYEASRDSFAVKCQETEDAPTETKILLMYFNDHKEVGITNIFLPNTMRRKGLGMKMLELVYQLSVKHGYELFIVDMVQSFYEKMLRKGAVAIDAFETVEIVGDTRLFSNN